MAQNLISKKAGVALVLDLIHPLNSREVLRWEVEVFASKHTCAWVEISAKTDANLIGE